MSRVLLVEDDPTDEKLTLRAFARWNPQLQLTVAHDGAEALDLLLGAGPRAAALRLPELVLLDLKLPRIGGLEVLRRLRADPRTAGLPVVILTASREEEDLRACYRLGCNAYLRKPVDFGDFQEAVSTIGTFWLVLNQRPEGGGTAP